MWLLPSLDRPESLKRFFAAFAATGGSTPGMVIVDGLDFTKHQYDYQHLDLPVNWRIRVTKARSQGGKIREIWDEIKDCAWLGLIGDDCVPETAGWDRALVDGIDGWNIVSCNDGWQAPRRLANCWVMGAGLIRTVGAIFPGTLQHLYVDDIWEMIGREAKCWSCRMDVMVRHVHVLKGEAKPDATHKSVYGAEGIDHSKGLWAEDEAEHTGWLENDGYRVVAAVLAARRAENLPALLPEARSEQRETREENLAPRSSSLAPQPGTIDYARTQRVYIATPIARHPVRQYTMALGKTLVALNHLGITAYIQNVVGSSNLPRARNELAAAFMASDYDDLLFIDDDMGWTPEAVVRLLAWPHDVIAGVGCKKVALEDKAPDKWCFRALPGAAFNQDAYGMIEVEAVGTGFMKISRRVFAAMQQAHPEWKSNGWPNMPEDARKHYYRYFRFADEPEEFGEDIGFCREWRRLGGSVWVDPAIRLVHVGETEFTGDFTALLQPASAELNPPPGGGSKSAVADFGAGTAREARALEAAE